jgi:peptidoglycan/LPS O-acetylase OafA/YrhL
VKSSPPHSELSAHADDLVPDLPPSENKRFYPALDGLRAIAVLLVFCEHYIYHPSKLRWGWIGVDIFFVLSGFLITGILYDTRETAHRFRNFYVRRTLRIFPLYYGVLLLALLLSPLLHLTWHPAWYLWTSYLGNYARFIYINDFISPHRDMVEDLVSKLPLANPLLLHMGHFWSLCVEEQFYLFWPLVVFLVKDRVRLRNFCIAVVLIEPFLRLICAFTLPFPLLYFEFLNRFTPLRIDALLLGGLVALCLRGPESNFVSRLAKPVILSVAGFFLAMEAIIPFFTHTIAEPDANITWISTFGFSAIDLLAAGMILLAIDPRTSFYRILNRPYLRRLGQMSYGFYVFHNIPLWLYNQIAMRVFKVGTNAEQILAAAIAFVCTVIISYLSFRFFESPFLRLKERFTA